jgi:hypothetical protein
MHNDSAKLLSFVPNLRKRQIPRMDQPLALGCQ